MIKNKQLTSNAGLYYICYELSKRGWNVLPTSRNAKGVDIMIYNQSANDVHTIEVKSSQSSFRDTIDMKDVLSEYLVICNKIRLNRTNKSVTTETVTKTPVVYICKKDQIDRDGIKFIHPSYYREFEGRWDLIGTGFDKT